MRGEPALPHPRGLVYVDVQVRRKGGPACTGPVVLGQRHDAALLGTLAPEALGLVLNPFERTLRPMRLMLARSA